MTFDDKLSDFESINKKIKALLSLISKNLQHNITLLIYSHDVESNEKLNFFELSFDNYKYFSRHHSIILDEHNHDISKALIFETRKHKSQTHLNNFIPLDISELLPSKLEKEISVLVQSLYEQCLHLKNVDNLDIYNYIQYSNNNTNVLRLAPCDL